MKFLLEIVISAILHPLAYLLALINILGRADLNAGQKLVWAIICIVWGIGPILYILIGGGELW
ncbi:MAG TPA: PLDc N-terminal domain-containing protein [Candidatus Dormibacteraeota bacterium]|nr:PLDc N-terminal domain-containing protein [Candidatus Dormibacteraeota bacterium]